MRHVLTLAAMLLWSIIHPTALVADDCRGAPDQREVVRLTLDEAIRRGLGSSHRVAEASARRDAASAHADGAEAANRPLVSLLAGYQRTNHVDEFAVMRLLLPPQVIYPDVPDNYRTRLDFAWPIYTGGRSEALTRAARSEAGATESDIQTERSDLRLEITRAFWAYLTASETVRVVDEALKRSEAHLTDVRNLLAVGLISPADVLSTEAQHSRERVLLIEARTTRENAATTLRRLVDLPHDADIQIEARIDEPAALLAGVDTMIADARTNRPERRAFEQRVTAAAERSRAAQAGRRPTMGVAAGYDYARPNPRIFPRADQWNDSWDVGVNVSWSLWNGGRVSAEIAEATAVETAAEERLAEFDSQLDADVRERRLDVESAIAAVDAATDSVRSSEEARRVQAERFRAGVSTSTDVLDAEVDLLQAGLVRTRALADVKLAEARLARVLGR